MEVDKYWSPKGAHFNCLFKVTLIACKREDSPTAVSDSTSCIEINAASSSWKSTFHTESESDSISNVLFLTSSEWFSKEGNTPRIDGDVRSIVGSKSTSTDLDLKGEQELSNTVAASLYERYLKDKDECITTLSRLKSKYAEMETQVVEAVEKKQQLATQLKEHREFLAKVAMQIQQERSTLCYEEEKLQMQLQTEIESNDSLRKERTALTMLLSHKLNDLNAIEGRNKAFEGKLDIASQEIDGIMEGVKQIQNDAALKKELYEKEIRKLAEECYELSKNISQCNAEIEIFSETQLTLENQLSLVKQEMVSLADHLAKKSSKRKDITTLEQVAMSGETPPTGEVTIVFCDIEDSVTLWETVPEAMLIALETYKKVLRDKLKMSNGYEVKSEAECFMVAFSNARDAIRWCHVVQEALLVAPWPDRLLSYPKCSKRTSADGRIMFRGPGVRMGVHSGRPDCKVNPITGRADYYGPPVNKCSRIQGLAQGGQLLTSEVVWKEIKEDEELMKNSSVEFLGRHPLRGFQDEELIIQILPKTLADRSFGVVTHESADVDVGIHEKINSRKAAYHRSKSKQEQAKESTASKEEDKDTQEGTQLVQEVSQLVSEIEATLRVHEHVRETMEENPLAKKKKHLSTVLADLSNQLEAAKEAVAQLKKEKHNLIKEEKNLKEELAFEVSQKEKFETRVREYIKDKIERDSAVEKTLQNLEALMKMQKLLEHKLIDAQKKRSSLFHQLKKLERVNPEAQLTALRERHKALQLELSKAEQYKEIRGKYLKSLENLIADTPLAEEEIEEDTKPIKKGESLRRVPSKRGVRFNKAVARAMRGVILGKSSDTASKGITDKIELLKNVSNQEQLLEHTKLEKQLYTAQLESLEAYFRCIDEEVAAAKRSEENNSAQVTLDPEQEKREIGDLKERLRAVQHQIAVAQAERDAFLNQLNALKRTFFLESTRKAKALDKAHTEIVYLMNAQTIIKKLLLDEFKAPLKGSTALKDMRTTSFKDASLGSTSFKDIVHSALKDAQNPSLKDIQSALGTSLRDIRSGFLREIPPAVSPDANVDVQSILVLQTSLEEQLQEEDSSKKLPANLQLELLSKVLRGEVLPAEDIHKLNRNKPLNAEGGKGSKRQQMSTTTTTLGSTKDDDNGPFMKILGRKIVSVSKAIK